MARNGSGTYSLLTNSWNPSVNGTPATAADWQSLINDVASAITQSISKDGQTPYTGNQPMGGNKLTGLGAGSAAGDSLRFEQLFSQGTPSNIASASTVDIGAQLTNFLNVTGTTTITSFGTNYNGPRFLRFAGALTLTHNATTLSLPTGANITTAAGDTCIVCPNSSLNGWIVVAYSGQTGQFANIGLNGGITFPATQVASANANTLDDYEEGTWTPAYTPASGAFGSITYNAATGGRYTKCGRIVMVSGSVIVASMTIGTASGNLSITGLPFVAGGVSVASLSAVTDWAGGHPTSGSISSGASAILLWKRTAINSADSRVQASDVFTGFGSVIEFSCTYSV